MADLKILYASNPSTVFNYGSKQQKCQLILTETDFYLFPSGSANQPKRETILQLSQNDLLGIQIRNFTTSNDLDTFQSDEKDLLLSSPSSSSSSSSSSSISCNGTLHLFYYPHRNPQENSYWNSLLSFFGMSSSPLPVTSVSTALLLEEKAKHTLTRYRREISLEFHQLTLDELQKLLDAFPKDLLRPTLTDGEISTTDQKRLQLKNSSLLVSKRFLIFVNPASGQGKSVVLTRSSILPMIHESNIPYELYITEYQGHIEEILQNKDPKKRLAHPIEDYSTILSIGGDGTYAEIINGLLERKEKDGKELLKKIPILPLPTGSGNALNRSILFANHETSHLINAVFNACRGFSFPKDLCEIHFLPSPQLELEKLLQKDKKSPPLDHPVHSFLLMAYGMMADLDINSEHLHALGELRFYIYAIIYVIMQKQYSATLTMKLLENPKELDNPKLQNIIIPTPGREKDPTWLTIESRKFAFIGILMVSHVSDTVYFGPGKQFHDERFLIVVGENVSRWEMVQILIKADTGEHIHLPGVFLFSCSEYQLTPLPRPESKKIVYGKKDLAQDIYSIDGERYPALPIYSKILPSGSRILLLKSV